MNNRQQLKTFETYENHKGFYNEKNVYKALRKIHYSDFFEDFDDNEFPYDTAADFLCGSCDIFAISLSELLNYSAYIISGKTEKSFHAFCQIYKNRQRYFVDVRGITTDFSEFMKDVNEFVDGEYTVRPLLEEDVKSWETDSYFRKEGYGFAKAIINKYKCCYTL